MNDSILRVLQLRRLDARTRLHVGASPLQLMGLVLMILIELHERETHLSAPKEQLGHTAPGLDCAEKEWEFRKWGLHEDQGVVTERQPPEHAFDDDQLGEYAYYAAQSGRSNGRCRYPGNILSTNVYQFRREIWGTRRPRLPPFLLMFQRRPQMGSVLSKPSLKPSPPLTLDTKFAYDSLTIVIRLTSL